MKRNDFYLLVVILLSAVLLGGFSQARIQAAGDWFPTLPDNEGPWEGIHQPVPQDTLALLGNPRGRGCQYVNHLGDQVYSTLVTAGSFENFHDPTVCVGGTGVWSFTAKKRIPLDGPGSAEVRAMIFQRREDPRIRLIMYYWQQTQDGHSTSNPMMGNYRDLPARFQTGYGAVVQGRKSVIVRIYSVYEDQDDPDGLRTQRNVHIIARATYRHLQKEGRQY